MGGTSMRSAFDKELMTVRDDIVRMGSLVDTAIDKAHRAFQSHDAGLAQEVIDSDKVINDLRYKVEEGVTATMALQAPLAHDLRMLLASLIISNELERVGDYAEGIARTVLRYPGQTVSDLPPAFEDMVQYVREMLRDAMDAYVQENVEKAESTALMDDRVDMLYRQMFKGIVEQMGKGLAVERGTYLLWAGHNVERIGDRVTNICERVVFARTGKTSRGFNPKPDHKEPPM